MNTFSERTKNNSSRLVENVISKKQSTIGSETQFVDNRPEAISQTNLKEKIQNNSKVKSVAAIQRRGFADPANPNRTRQWEGRGTPWRTQGKERPADLAAIVDQFKKEMLTYIAHCIETQQTAGYYGPHIAVVISGNNWHVSVNSNVAPVNKGNLQTDANAVKLHINQCWQALHNTYNNNYFKIKGNFFKGIWRNITYPFQTYNEEAVYIAFRWAAGKQNIVNIVNNPHISNRRRVHGEMQIINHLQAAPAGAGAALPGGATTVLPGTFRRVVRVGGTKTPCLDCGWEMGKVPYNPAQIGVGAVGSHGALHEAHMIGAGPNERVATTMAPEFGQGFGTWQSTDHARPRRTAALHPGTGGAPAAAGYQANQAQNYQALRATYTATDCAPAMV